MGVIVSRMTRQTLPAEAWESMCRVIALSQCGFSVLIRSAADRRVYDYQAGNAAEFWVSGVHVRWCVYDIEQNGARIKNGNITSGRGSSAEAVTDVIAEMVRRRVESLTKHEKGLKHRELRR